MDNGMTLDDVLYLMRKLEEKEPKVSQRISLAMMVFSDGSGVIGRYYGFEILQPAMVEFADVDEACEKLQALIAE